MFRSAAVRGRAWVEDASSAAAAGRARQLRRRQLRISASTVSQQAARAFQLPEELLEAVIFLHHRIQVGVQLGRPLILRGIRQHDWVGEPLHDLPMPPFDGIQLVVQC
jgi:hypothetical protein